MRASLLLILLLAACGHRGPLYLPGKPGDPAYDRQQRDARPPQSARPPANIKPRDDDD